MLRDRLPAATEEILAHLSGEPEGCLRELQTASGILDREGFVGRPSWQELRAGARPPPPLHCRPWGMGTWLAVLRVFRFRTPLSGDRSACQVMPRRPGSLEVALRPRFRSGSPRFAYRSRVSSAAVAVPDTCIGEVAAPTDLDRGQVRVWRPERHFWKTPGRLPIVW